MDNGERLHRSPRVVSRDALPSRKAKAECTRVWAGEMPSNIPGHAPRAGITFRYCRRPAGIFIRLQWSDSPERVQRSKLFVAEVSRSIGPLAERYARLRLWNCLPGCRSLRAAFPPESPLRINVTTCSSSVIIIGHLRQVYVTLCEILWHMTFSFNLIIDVE